MGVLSEILFTEVRRGNPTKDTFLLIKAVLCFSKKLPMINKIPLVLRQVTIRSDNYSTPFNHIFTERRAAPNPQNVGEFPEKRQRFKSLSSLLIRPPLPPYEHLSQHMVFSIVPYRTSTNPAAIKPTTLIGKRSNKNK